MKKRVNTHNTHTLTNIQNLSLIMNSEIKNTKVKFSLYFIRFLHSKEFSYSKEKQEGKDYQLLKNRYVYLKEIKFSLGLKAYVTLGLINAELK